ncbi:MAG: LD-carboxypeptidase [Chloroflexota bacterium]
MLTLKPPTLTTGDTIGIVAPSLPLFSSWQSGYEQGKALLRSWGFELHEGNTIQLQHWWSAGTPREQAEDIHAMFIAPSIRAIVTLAGGFSALPVLDKLDYALIRQHPKPFIGMSDITLYHWAMLSQSGLLGFHGNTLLEGFADFYTNAPTEHQLQLKETYLHLLTDPTPLGTLPQLAERTCLRPGIAQGKLIGGNLKRFVTLTGTKYDLPKSMFDGAILFWEEIGETLYDISMNLYKLAHLGVFDQIAGMIIGKLTWVNQYFDEIDHPAPYEAILYILNDYSFPILAADDFGHQMSMLPLVMGLDTRIDSVQGTIELIEAATI